MTAGRINPDWLDAARANHSAEPNCVEDWFARVENVTDVYIDDEGSVLAVNSAGHRHWLSQDQIDHVVRMIDEGV